MPTSVEIVDKAIRCGQISDDERDTWVRAFEVAPELAAQQLERRPRMVTAREDYDELTEAQLRADLQLRPGQELI